MIEVDNLLEAIAPFQIIFVLIGTALVVCGVVKNIFILIGDRYGNQGLGTGISMMFFGGVIAFNQFTIPLFVSVMSRIAESIGFGSYDYDEENVSDKDTSAPEPPPAVQPPADTTNSPPADLSWVPGTLVILGVVVALVAVALGVFHYYRKHLQPSLAKSRSEASSASLLVEEARNALKWVILDSATYETDLAKQIDYPMMTDVSEPLVSKYVRQMRQVHVLERALAKKPLLADAQSFSEAVIELKVSYEAAVRRAEKVRWSSFSVAEQKCLKDARTALNVIQDASTTPEQRNAQYRRIAKLLEGIIVLTEPVRQSLSQWVPMLALNSSTPASDPSETKVSVPA